jgi:hypothetical protein
VVRRRKNETILEAIPFDEPILDALPADEPVAVAVPSKPEKGSEKATDTKADLPRGKLPVPLPLPPPKPAAKPTLLKTLGTPALVGILIGLPLAVLLLYLLWPASSTGRHRQPEPPQLRPVPPLKLKAGKRFVLAVPVERGDETGELRVKVDGLPGQVKYTATAILPHQSESTVKLEADVESPAVEQNVSVSLWTDRQVAVQTVPLNVQPFRRPLLHPVGPVVIKQGARVQIRVAVDRQGNTDPLEVRVEDLPPGVRQEEASLPEGSPEDVVPLVLSADPSAEPAVKISRLTLLADGVLGAEQLLSVSLVAGVKPQGYVSMSLPGQIDLSGATRRTLPLEFTRTDPSGEIRFQVADLPDEVACEPVTVGEGLGVVYLEFRVTKPVARTRTARVQVLASVEKFVVGRGALDLRLGPKTVPGEAIPIVTVRKIVPLPETVQFTTCDWVQIQGTFYPPIEKKKGLTVLMLQDEGARRSDENWERLARALQKQGHAVLTFDFRGHGDSTVIQQPNLFWRQPSNSPEWSSGFVFDRRTGSTRRTSSRDIRLNRCRMWLRPGCGWIASTTTRNSTPATWW